MPELSVYQKYADFPDELKQSDTIVQDIAATVAYTLFKVSNFPIEITSCCPQLFHSCDIGIFIRFHKIFL